MSTPPASRLHPAFAFVYAFLLGFLLWALSPWLFGVAEPWDTDSHVYPAVLVSGGVILAQLDRRPFVAGYLGVWLGQLAAVLLPWQDGTWWALGVVTTALGSLFFLAGAGAGWAFRRALGRMEGGEP